MLPVFFVMPNQHRNPHSPFILSIQALIERSAIFTKLEVT